MRDLEQYRGNLEFCLTNAAKAPFSELRAIWQTLAESYTFLIALELDPRHARGPLPRCSVGAARGPAQ